jgi:ubiquinone/menaquinone biosynthesis C-methylase UbiE
MKNILENKDFFELIASEYDDMISFDESVERKKKSFSKIIKPVMKTVCDLGSGTGTDAIALSFLGFNVTAFEPSLAMQNVARANSQSKRANVTFVNSTIEAISKNFNSQFDLLVSMGNTFANVNREGFAPSIQKCFDILNSVGLFVIQVLNYEKIISEQKRIVNIKEGTKNYFIRFYDFIEDEMVFNILIFNKSNPVEHNLISTKIYPYLIEDFILELKKAGFKSIDFYADLELTKFDKSQSKNLIIKAFKE